MRCIVATTRAEAEAIRDRVDAAYGLPRCERLAGGITRVGGGIHATCECTVASAPVASCQLATRSEASIHRLRDGRIVYHVPAGRTLTASTLTAAERARITTVPDADLDVEITRTAAAAPESAR